MKKESVKSFILVLLIFSSIGLTGKLWLNEKLWPSGYNFFVSAQNNPTFRRIVGFLPFVSLGPDTARIYESVLRPEKLVVSGSGAREVYFDGQVAYDQVYQEVGGVMATLFSSQNPRSAQISKDDWKSFLKAKSVYMDFGGSRSIATVAKPYTDNPLAPSVAGMENVRGLVFAADSITNELLVCGRNEMTGQCYKFWVEGKGGKLLNLIESLTYGRQQNLAFAFELGLDGGSDMPAAEGQTEVERNVHLSEMTLLSIGESRHPLVQVSNPIRLDEDNVPVHADSIITAFGYTPSSLRKSVLPGKEVTYVENSATVRVLPNGAVEYTAVETSAGIPVDDGKTDASSAVSAVVELAGSVWERAASEQMPELRLVSDLIDNRDYTYTVVLRYVYDSVPAVTDYAGGGAVIATVKNGYITEFKMLLRTFESTEQTGKTEAVIDALNRLFAQHQSGENVEITNLYNCYPVAKSGVTSACWGVEFEGVENVVFVLND